MGVMAIALVSVIGISSASIYNDASALAAVSTVSVEKKTSKYDDTIKENEKEKEKYQQMANSVQAQIDNYKSEYNSILTLVDKLDKEMEELSGGLFEVNQKMDELDVEIAKTNIEYDEAKRIRDEQYDKMKARIKYVYENGESNMFEILLDSDNLIDVLNRVEYVSEIAKYDDEMFDQFKKAAIEVAEIKAKLESQKETYQAAKESYEKSLEYAEKLAEEKKKAMTECASKLNISVDLYREYMVEIESKQKTIDQIKKEKAAAEAKEKQDAIKAEQIIKDQQASGQVSTNITGSGTGTLGNTTDNKNIGQMIWPSPGYSRISSYFGPRKQPVPGASTYHKGLDIGAPFGAKTVAALAGTVESAGCNNSMGNYVCINHGNGVRTIYMHASKLLVKTGDYVKQGQVIQLVGSTGISQAAHLHFAITINGVYVNPLNYVKY